MVETLLYENSSIWAVRILNVSFDFIQTESHDGASWTGQTDWGSILHLRDTSVSDFEYGSVTPAVASDSKEVRISRQDLNIFG